MEPQTIRQGRSLSKFVEVSGHVSAERAMKIWDPGVPSSAKLLRCECAEAFHSSKPSTTEPLAGAATSFGCQSLF